MMTNPIGGISAGNAAYNWMSAANSLMGVSFRGNSNSSASLLASDKNLTLGMLNDSFQYRAYSAMQESQDKITKDNIKRSFSIFA